MPSTGRADDFKWPARGDITTDGAKSRVTTIITFSIAGSVGLGVDEAVWVPTVFTKNRDRLLEADVARKFLAELMDHNELRGLLSDEHFSVDGPQVAAWASMKSFRAKDGSDDPPGPSRNGERDFHGEKHSNATHASTTDPEAQLYRKGRGKEAKLSLHGPHADGKPQRTDRRGHVDPGDRYR